MSTMTLKALDQQMEKAKMFAEKSNGGILVITEGCIRNAR